MNNTAPPIPAERPKTMENIMEMKAAEQQPNGWVELIHQIGPDFAARADKMDDSDTFVEENYKTLKTHKLFSAGVPADLGGGGMSHREMCAMLRALAGYCGSTALSFSMHQHIIALTVYNHLHGKPGKPLLEKVAAKELVLISTGGNDWLSSSGTMEKVEGGFRVNARKAFASGCPMGDILSTSAQYNDPDAGWQVLHFPVAFASEGVSIENDWEALGMRATGSHTVVYDNVFVPEETVAVRRPRGAYHGLWDLVLPSAMPPIMAVYLGAVEKAVEIAREKAKKKLDNETIPYLVGEMENSLTVARMAVEGMIDTNDDYRFTPSLENTNELLKRKTIASRAILETAEKALETAGGGAFYRKLGLERILRDVHASQFHPLPEKQQHRFTGRLVMGLDPVGDPGQ